MKELKTFYFTSVVNKGDYSTRNIFIKVEDDTDEDDKLKVDDYERYINGIDLTYNGQHQWTDDIKERITELEYTDEVHPDTRTFVLDRLPIGRGMTDRHLLYMVEGLLRDNIDNLPNVIHSIRISPAMIDPDDYSMNCKVLVRGHDSRNDEELETFLKSDNVDIVDSYDKLATYFTAKGFDSMDGVDREHINFDYHYFLGDIESIDGWLEQMDFDRNRTQYGFYLNPSKNETGGVDIRLEKYIITKFNDKYYIQK